MDKDPTPITETHGNYSYHHDEFPKQIGDYRLIKILGRGGMGTVYLVEQEQPVHRFAALKVINYGMDAAPYMARFEAERQALALMNHPNIATVYDFGTTLDGLPYFVMEYVEGEPLCQYCTRMRLPLEARLKLFSQICDAVAHAHQKMIIHRDLKPSNILVGTKDGEAIPKVIDFGIAKGLAGPLVDSTSLQTREGNPVGTPLYMSPEQIEGGGRGLDARTDVYALGVVLFELMVGVPPFDTEKADYISVLMKVLDDKAVRPWQRYDSLGQKRQTLASERRTTPKNLSHLLRGDLEWILLKAMEKDRDRRYSSVGQLREDLDRYLGHLPVKAGPPSLSYRLKKFVRRNRIAVTAIALLFLSLTGGITATSLSLVRANRAVTEARAAEDRANASVAYLRKVLASVDPHVEGRKVRVIDILKNASKIIAEDLKGQPEVEASVRKTLGWTYLELGFYDDAEVELKKTVALQKGVLGEDHLETLNSYNAVGRLYYKKGRYAEAETIHREVLQKEQQIQGREHPTTLWTMYNLAKALDKQGKLAEAEILLAQNVRIRERILGPSHPHTMVAINSYAILLNNLGKFVQAEALQRRNLLDLEKRLGQEHPNSINARANLVKVLNHQQNFAQALDLGRKTLQLQNRILGSEHPETLTNRSEVAVALAGEGQFSAAEQHHRQILAIRREKLGENHPDTIDSCMRLGHTLFQQKKYNQARGHLSQGLELAARHLNGEPARLANYQADFGRCLLALNAYEQAERYLLAAYTAYKKSQHRERGRVLDELIQLYDAWNKPDHASRYRAMQY